MKIKKINVNTYTWYKSYLKINKNFLLKIFILLFSIFFIFISWGFIYSYLSSLFKKGLIFSLIWTSKVLWTDIKKDDFWQLNILILWAWWDNWPGGWLTDTIMLASYNPELQALTFLSIPRDLYIYSKKYWYKWRINWIFQEYYFYYKNKLWDEIAKEKAVEVLSDVINDITWVKVQKYVIITFQWFVEFINHIWWVKVNIPYRIVDPEYPSYNWWYVTIRFEPWEQVLNWRDALIYARTRHTTSDFSRSKRQQQIIQWVIEKLINEWYIFNIKKLRELYFKVSLLISTNFTWREILSLIYYYDKIKHIFNFVYNSDCLEPWCLVYPADRDLFWWASVLLPYWWSPSNPNFYKYTQLFAFIVIYNQDFLIKSPSIKIMNCYTKFRKNLWYELWTILKNYAFKVEEISKCDEPIKKTLLVHKWEKVDLFKFFLDFEEKVDYNQEYDIIIMLWDDFKYKRY